MLCALGLYLYISPMLLAVILLITVPPLVLPRMMNERLKQTRDRFSSEMAMYTGQLKELLGGFELIRSFLREDAYNEQHRAASHKAEESELNYQQSLNAVIVNTSLISNLIFPSSCWLVCCSYSMERSQWVPCALRQVWQIL